MMTPEEKGSLPIRVEKLFYELQDRIFSDIVRRIRKTKKITSTADYQINKLLLLGGSTEFIESELKRLLTLSDPEIWEMYDKVCEWEYVRNRDAYEQINGNFTPLEDNDTIQGWSQAIVAQTQNEIKNLTRSLGMTVDIGGGKMAFTPLAEYYQKHLDNGDTVRKVAFHFCSRVFFGAADNIDTSDFYEHFSEWLEECTRKGNFPKLESSKEPRYIRATTNGYMTDNETQTARYAIWIIAVDNI